MLKKTEFSLTKKVPYTTHEEKIPLDLINVLPQPRRTFEEIPLLADDIAAKGLINPITVGLFTPAQCRQYLQVINSV